MSPTTAPTDRRRFFIAAGCGALAAGGHAPLSLPILTVLALAAAIRAMPAAGARGLRPAAWFGWALGTGYFAIALHWIVEPFLVDIARHGWMAPFALVLLAGGLALFWAAAAAAAVWLAGPGAGPGRRGLALVLTLTVAEGLRGWVFTGFPWALLGTVWVETPLRMLAAWIGPHGLGAATLGLAAGLATLPASPPRWRAVMGAGLALALACGWALGASMVGAVPPAPPGAPVLRLVQPNAAQHLKWRADMIPVFWARQLEFTASQSAVPPVAVIWPEVSLPYLLGRDADADRSVAAAAGGAVVLAGAQRFEGRELRNALALIAPDGPALAAYDKHHLVPFGEYFPGGRLAASLGFVGFATDALGGFTPGAGPALVDLSEFGLGRVRPLICYEVIFPRYARGAGGERPDWLVQVTNDAWFGQFAGPQQHLAQARMRAVEQGLPLARSANTGISALVDAAGRLHGTLALSTAGFADVALPPPQPPTPFARLRHWPLAAALGALALALLGARGSTAAP